VHFPVIPHLHLQLLLRDPRPFQRRIRESNQLATPPLPYNNCKFGIPSQLCNTLPTAHYTLPTRACHRHRPVPANLTFPRATLRRPVEGMQSLSTLCKARVVSYKYRRCSGAAEDAYLALSEEGRLGSGGCMCAIDTTRRWPHICGACSFTLPFAALGFCGLRMHVEAYVITLEGFCSGVLASILFPQVGDVLGYQAFFSPAKFLFRLCFHS
jgi:hypothetical protein